METKQRVKELFETIDRRDANGFLSHLSENVRFRFGNADALEGKAAVGEVVSAFFQSIKGLSHDVQDIVQQGDRVVACGEVVYTRHDGSALQAPFADFLELKSNLVTRYNIYVDISQLYQKT